MRFITEFELVANKDAVDAYRANGLWNISLMIRDSFGWKEDGFINQKGLTDIRYTLEIEAFPMDKWIEFKNRLFYHIKICNEHNSNVDINRILEIIKELESFGKQAGATKEESSK